MRVAVFFFLILMTRLLVCFKVFIAVENENDNTPLTVEPVYYPSIPENSPAGKIVVELKAVDHDLDPTQRLTFRITSGNPGGSFSINSDTGKMLILSIYCLNSGV
jgi:protocadherin Fat 1/2/3